MLVGSVSEVENILNTAPWGTEHCVTWHEYRLDGERGWSLFMIADPIANDDAEGLVYALGPGRKRAALIGMAQKRRVYETNDMLRDTAKVRDLRDLARLLQRFEHRIR